MATKTTISPAHEEAKQKISSASAASSSLGLMRPPGPEAAGSADRQHAAARLARRDGSDPRRRAALAAAVRRGIRRVRRRSRPARAPKTAVVLAGVVSCRAVRRRAGPALDRSAASSRRIRSSSRSPGGPAAAGSASPDYGEDDAARSTAAAAASTATPSRRRAQAPTRVDGPTELPPTNATIMSTARRSSVELDERVPEGRPSVFVARQSLKPKSAKIGVARTARSRTAGR